ncbi:MAG: MBL fold metallo-hydrolase [Calditrichae bacterium]|nr:MBL fold metallo-hydrolase [Calditrichia bacterium]
MTRHLSISFALLLIFNPAVHSQTPPASPEHKLIDEIKAHTSGMAIWWTGHNGWLIKQDSILIGTDLVLENEDRQSPAPVSAAEIAPLLDISFITHEHGDHFGRNTSRILAEQSNCMFVMPVNCVEIAKAETGIPAARIRAAIPRQPFTLRGVGITPMRAIHGNPKFAVF